ncbi:MAG: TonB-dependent receptor [Longimicrobiales bacterium]
MNRLLVRSLLLGGFLASAAAPATAQSAADTVPTFNLDSLVVSVLGTPIRFGQSPFPISVLGERELRDGKTGMFLEEALQTLPGVQVQNRYNYAVGERISIRGFGSRAQFGVRGINVVVDGIPATLADGQSTLDHVDIASLGRVEALRGPASALYGNASGGVLRFETELSAMTPASAEITSVAGSDGMLRLQGTTSGSVGDAAYLVSLNRLEYDGFRHFGTGATTGAAYGGASRWHVNGRLEQALGRGELGIMLNFLDLDSENPGSITRAQFNADPDQIAAIYNTFQTGKEVQQGQLGVSWRGPVGNYSIEASSYGLTRDFSNPLPNDVVDLDRRAAGVRLTLGRSTMAGSTDIGLLVGGEYDLQDDDRREYTNNAGIPDTLTLNQTEGVRSGGAFLQATVSPGDALSFVGAVRYDHTHFEVDDLVRPVTGNPDDSGSRDMNRASGSLGVHVSVTPAIGLFANAGTFFDTPTTVELGNQQTQSGGFNPALDPMTGKSAELGARGTFADRVAFEVSAFRMWLENELISGQNVDGLDYFYNMPKTERVGIDAILRARLLSFATAQVSYTYIDATFEEGVDRYGNDVSGNKVPGLAPQQLQASAKLTRGAWYLDVNAEYTDEVAVNDRNCLVVLVAGACPLNATGGRQDGFTRAYTLFGARAGGDAIEIGGVQVSPFVGIQNALDQRYMSSVVPNSFAFSPNHTGVRFYEPGPGRTFYAGASLAVSR